MMSYLYDVNASDVIQPYLRICNFPKRVTSSSPHAWDFHCTIWKGHAKRTRKRGHTYSTKWKNGWEEGEKSHIFFFKKKDQFCFRSLAKPLCKATDDGRGEGGGVTKVVNGNASNSSRWWKVMPLKPERIGWGRSGKTTDHIWDPPSPLNTLTHRGRRTWVNSRSYRCCVQTEAKIHPLPT